MSSAPAMPVFPDAYLADTTHLSTEEHGAYFLLLMAMWRRNGTVPDDDRDIARIVGLDLKAWRKMRKRLMPFLTVEGDFLTQKRLKKEWDYVSEKRTKNAINGARGGRPRDNINNRLDKANGSQNENPNDNRNESPHNPEPNPIEKLDSFSERASARKPNGFVHVRKSTDAARSLIQELKENEQFGEDQGDKVIDQTVREFPAIAHVRS
ncbi:YdaU family protein [Phyllobacterium lublinensis]|uniref:YdaU family protein n=1 Tax=Phyllobacterium lublinensis TaxID=2875708 RepID=UPI001CCFA609|nr:DUF1376 domain-containing protein [Phyllobacterium sp. 2063]MBZ9653524.1 DUF1376 domain-containing protein [Phyllobacterium sp. 2063]